MTPSPEPRQPPSQNEQSEQARQRKAFVVLAIVLAIAVAAWVITQRMRAYSALQDCVMAGHSNCTPGEAGNP
jgi:hypothetical protein